MPSLQIATQAEQPLTVLAERLDAERHRLGVRPEDTVAFIPDLLFLSVSRRVAAEENV
jgi:hypothetical protein